MITKTEVLQAIAECEPAGGWGPLDRSLVSVPKGALHVLIEAAKRTKFRVHSHGDFMGTSNSNLVLDEV